MFPQNAHFSTKNQKQSMLHPCTQVYVKEMKENKPYENWTIAELVTKENKKLIGWQMVFSHFNCFLKECLVSLVICLWYTIPFY